MDFGLQLTEQTIRYSHVGTAKTLAIDATTNKQVWVHCVISLTCLRVLSIGMKNRLEGIEIHIRVILILHVAVLIRNLLNNKDLTEITNNYYLEEFNLIGSFDTNTVMSSNSLSTPAFGRITRIQRVKTINFDYENGEKKIRIKETR